MLTVPYRNIKSYQYEASRWKRAFTMFFFGFIFVLACSYLGYTMAGIGQLLVI